MYNALERQLPLSVGHYDDHDMIRMRHWGWLALSLTSRGIWADACGSIDTDRRKGLNLCHLIRCKCYAPSLKKKFRFYLRLFLRVRLRRRPPCGLFSTKVCKGVFPLSEIYAGVCKDVSSFTGIFVRFLEKR